MRKLKLFMAACALTLGSMSGSAQSWTGNAPAEGKFFLYNVGAEKYINNGDPAQEWGTNAYLQAGFGLDIQLEANDGAYNLNTNVSNGGNNHYLATSTWTDGAATPWTFTAVDGQTNTYTISNGSSYLVANDALNDIVYGAITNDNKSWWKLVSLNDFKSAMQAKTYSATDPMDVSVFIQGRSFARNDGRNDSWTTTHNGGNWVWIGASANKYYGNEAWNNTFSVSQTVENLPDGTYELKCSGFGTNGTTYIFANTTSQVIQSDNTTDRGTSKEAKWTAIHEDNAFAGQTTGKFTLSGGTLNLGIKRETNQGGDWAIWDEFRLYYYGLDLSEFAATLAAAVEAAEAVNGTVPTAAYNALAAVVNENNKTYTTAAEYTAAANAIEEATTTAKALQANYTRYNSIKTAATAINANLDTGTADSEVNAATTNEAIDAAIATLRSAFLAELPNLTVPTDPGYIDVTSVMVDNASVSTNTDFWTIANLSSSGGSAGVCNYGECEFYNRNFKFYQTLALTPGTWEFGVTGFHRAGNHKTYFYAGEDKILIPGVANTVVNTMAAAKDYFDAGNGKVALKFLVETAQDIEIGIDNQDTETDKWTIFRNFTLKYYGEPDYSVYEAQWDEAVAAAEEALTTYAEFDGFVATEKNALTTAKADAPTAAGLKAGYLAKIGALTDATAAYIASCQKFESAKAAIAKANAIKDAHNFASSDATTTFAEAIAAISDKYDAGTLTQEEAAAAGTTLGTAVTDNRANPDGAAVNYLENGFGLTNYEASLYINTWSTEGDNDGSNFSVPFYEYWVADANALGEKTWTGTLTDMPNGQYKISVWVRVRAKDGEAAADATGITIDVNGGDAIDVTQGSQIGESQFTIGTYEAVGLVKDGKLIFNVNIASDNNISWLSFQNVKYTKVRDLTPEEMAVAPTAIALYNGETEVTETIELTATANTVTLTPSYTPADASEGYITWTSSDENVATVTDGVVTGVAPGTATITATSTLDDNVKAEVTITVTYPESEYASEKVTNDGATRSTITLGENIIKNGSFEYPDAFYGWTSGTGSKLTSSSFSIQTSGAYSGSNYLKASVDKGQADAGSIYTSWPVEAGKTYLFSYQMKNSSAISNDDYIRTSLSATTAEDATSYNETFKAVSCGTEWTELSYEFTVPEGKNYLVFSARWLKSSKSFDNFYLCEVQSKTTVGNVDYAKEAIPTANIGTGAFQYSQDAIDAANALVQGTATVEDVEAAYEALTTLNAPTAEQVFNIVMGDLTWTNNNNATMLSTVGKAVTYYAGGRSDAGGYTSQFDKEPNTNLAQAFYFTAAEGKNKYTIHQIDAEGNNRYLCTGTVYGGNANQVRTTTEATSAEVYTITAIANEGVYNFTNSSNINLGAQDLGLYGTNRNNNLKIVETSKPSIAINTTAAGWGTTILPFAVATLPEGVKVYTCAETAGSTLTLVEVNTLEANKPYIIEGNWNETLTGDAQGTALNYTEGLLTGTYVRIPAENGTYILQNHNGKVGFYQVDTNEAQPYVPANRAYLNESAGARAAYFFADNDATGINAIEGLTAGEATIYNVNGVQQQRLQKGMNIIVTRDGRSHKVMVK